MAKRDREQTMSISGDTIGPTPDSEPTVKTPTKTIDETIGVVRNILEKAYIDTIAAELPLQHQQAHDDEKPTIVREWLLASLDGLLTAERLKPRVRYEPVGATVIIRDGMSTPWVLIDPAYLENTAVRDLLQRACSRWTPETLARIHERMESEAAPRKARAAKALATRRKNAATTRKTEATRTAILNKK